jgi:hypothetical protein
MRKIILTDLDDTVLNCSEVLERFAKDRLGMDSIVPFRDATNLQQCFAQTIPFLEEILIHEFWNSDAFGKLKPEPCAKIVIPKLHDMGYEFVGITACPNTIEIVNKRKANLKEAFGFDWLDVHCTFPNRKITILDKYKDTACIWVEDNLQNCLDGLPFGYECFLLDRKHNSHYIREDIMRINTWNNILSYMEIA